MVTEVQNAEEKADRLQDQLTTCIHNQQVLSHRVSTV
jgi:hypothetical protein